MRRDTRRRDMGAVVSSYGIFMPYEEERQYHEKKNGDLMTAKKDLYDAQHQFDNTSRLFDVQRNSTFVFNHHGNHNRNQQRYEYLGKIVERYIYGLLQDKSQTGEQLVKTFLPVPYEQSKDFIFHTQDINKYEKILMLMHGSGVVRAGQWSRKLIMNVSIDAGSMLPYIRKAHRYGYGVVVVNINQPYDHQDSIFRSPDDHFIYVWKNLIEKIPNASVAIVTHSFGGSVVMNAAKNIPSFRRRAFAVALTDCWVSESPLIREWLQMNVCNWVTSHQPLGQHIQRSHSTLCKTVSGGTTVHEETPWKAFADVWRFIGKQEQIISQRSSSLTKSTNVKEWSHGLSQSEERVGRASIKKSSTVIKRSTSFDRKTTTNPTNVKRSTSFDRKSTTKPINLKRSTSCDRKFDQPSKTRQRSSSTERKYQYPSTSTNNLKRFASQESLLQYRPPPSTTPQRSPTKSCPPYTLSPLTIHTSGKKMVHKKPLTKNKKHEPVKPPYATYC